MSNFSRSGKKKLAFALACASVFGGRTSAMNSKMNINKTGVKSSQTLGAVGDATVNKDFSNNKAKGFGNWAKNNNKPVLIAATAAVTALVAVSVIGFTILGSKKDNGQNPEFPNDPTKIKNLPPVVEKSKELFFDNISTKEQMFDALKKIAQNYKFFGLNSSVVGFNSEATFKENDDAVEFYKQRNSNFKTQDDINKIQQNLNNLKNQLANIETAIGAKISSENDIKKTREEYVKLKRKFLEVPDVGTEIDKFLNNNLNKQDNEFKYFRREDYINGKQLNFLLFRYKNFADWINDNNNEMKRLIEFEKNEDKIRQILSDIKKCNSESEISDMNANFINTIGRSKQFRKLFAPPVKIQDFKIVFNKTKGNLGDENKQNICFEFNFYDDSNQKLWCRYNMNFKDRKVEIAVSTQTQDISVQ